MTAKEYLSEVSSMRYRVKHIKRKIADFEEEMSVNGAIRYDKERVQTSLTNSQEDKIINLVDLKIEYIKEKIRLEEEELYRLRQVDDMTNRIGSTILRLRFFDLGQGFRLHTLGWIADEMGYTEDYIKHQYTDALAEFEKLYLSDHENQTPKSTES